MGVSAEGGEEGREGSCAHSGRAWPLCCAKREDSLRPPHAAPPYSTPSPHHRHRHHCRSTQGEALLAAQRAWVQQALAGAYRVQLGGPAGAAAGWPTCLAVSLAAGEGSLRSQLGNELAMKSREGGMAPAGIVAYREAGMAAAAGAGEEGDGGGNDDIKLSLRAVDGFDTTVVTKVCATLGPARQCSCRIHAAAAA